MSSYFQNGKMGSNKHLMTFIWPCEYLVRAKKHNKISPLTSVICVTKVHSFCEQCLHKDLVFIN